MNTNITTKKLPNHDLATLLRLVAITLIVSAHFDLLDYRGGGAALLMIIVGYNIATFKLPNYFKYGSIKPFAIMIAKVIIPTIAYTTLLHLIFGPIRYQEILLISNFYTDRHPNGFAYWFIEVYIQILLILLALLAIPIIHKTLKSNTEISLLAFAILASLMFIISESLWDLNDLYRRVPWLMLWMVAFGMATKYANNIYYKITLTILFIIASTVYYSSIHWFLVICTTLLIFDIPLRLPSLIKKPVYFMASGSLFIYLTHFQSRSLVEKLISDNPLLNTISAIIIGAILFKIYDTTINKKLFEKIAKNKL